MLYEKIRRLANSITGVTTRNVIECPHDHRFLGLFNSHIHGDLTICHVIPKYTDTKLKRDAIAISLAHELGHIRINHGVLTSNSTYGTLREEDEAWNKARIMLTCCYPSFFTIKELSVLFDFIKSKALTSYVLGALIKDTILYDKEINNILLDMNNFCDYRDYK